MTKFNYEGHDKLGQPVTGFVEADSEAKAAQIIRQERGHYAREISTDDIKPIYERPAVGAVVQREPEEETVPPDVVEQPPVAADPNLLQKTLKEDIEAISEVLRQLNEWKLAYRTSSEGKLPLPPGVPAVGGKTWECYEKHFDEIAKHLFKLAASRGFACR
jgi:hypothetical protein